MNKPVIIDIAGIYPAGEGYSNNRFFLEQLVSTKNLQLDQKSSYPVVNEDLFASSQATLIDKTRFLARTIVFSFYAAIRSAYRRKQIDAVYIPYPSIACLLVFSIIPKTFRPFIIADGLISLYDTAVTDRELFNHRSLKARLLYSLEKRSISTCNHFICDTSCNADYYSNLLKLPRRLFTSLPLAINEQLFAAVPPPEPNRNIFNVLFFGSFSPLHGIDIILESARLLGDHSGIHLTVIGKGQVAAKYENLLLQTPNVTWLNNWVDNKTIANHVKNSDIILGVFGRSSKSKRVIPFKIYTALCSARPVVTGETDCTELRKAGVITLDKNTPENLAQAILKLYLDPELCKKLSEQARIYFRDYLSHPRRYMGIVKLISGSDIQTDR